MWKIYRADGTEAPGVNSEEEAENTIKQMAEEYAVDKGIDPDTIEIKWARGQSNYYLVARPKKEESTYWPSAIGKLTKAEFDEFQARMKEGAEIVESQIKNG